MLAMVINVCQFDHCRLQLISIHRGGDNGIRAYVEAVKNCGDRTRSVIYVNILLISVVISIVRNYGHPSWEFQEFTSARRVVNCISSIMSDRSGPVVHNEDVSNTGAISMEEFCQKSLKSRFKIDLKSEKDQNNAQNKKSLSIEYLVDRAKQKSNKDERDPLLSLILQTYTNEVNNRTNHEFFRIPLFGIELHQNDVWIVTRIFSLASLILLRTCLRSEYFTLRGVEKIIPNNNEKLLLLSTQVLSAPHKYRQHGSISSFLKWVVFGTLYLSIPLMHLYIIFQDFNVESFKIMSLLIGEREAVYDNIARVVMFFILMWMGAECCRYQIYIDQKVEDISAKNYGAKSTASV